MHPTAGELLDRTRRFAASVAALCDRLSSVPGAERAARTLIASSRAMAGGYQDVCATPSPEKFISGISAVAVHAKRARASLQMLLQLNHVTLADARDLLFEARGLEAIFRASRDTAKRRHRARRAGGAFVLRRHV